MFRIQPSSAVTSNVTFSGPGTVNVPVKYPSNENSASTPACSPFPAAAIVLHEPSFSGTTSVNGRVFSSTPVVLVQLVSPGGGLKLTFGKSCSKAGVSLGVRSNAPLSFGFVKKLPV